jgi:hypothetical protein
MASAEQNGLDAKYSTGTVQSILLDATSDAISEE